MALSKVYVQSISHVGSFFSRIQEGQAPEQFTQQHIKDLGFTSSNDRAFVPLMKSLGFLTSEGIPTQRYQEYRNRARSHRTMGEAIREAYSDLFVIREKPSSNDRDLIEGKFKTTHNVTDRLAKLMANTFFALLEIADLNQSSK